jgi:hypothetical protein
MHMTLHQTIKNQITEALRAKDVIRLNTLRGLQALFLNEMLAQKTPAGGEFLPDDKVLTLIKRSVNQRKDSIRQFEIGKRVDLADKERAELAILQSFLPATMSRDEIKAVAASKVAALQANGPLDAAAVGKLTGMIMKELAGKADGSDVKAVLEELVG